jgi:hypothetical protein
LGSARLEISINDAPLKGDEVSKINLVEVRESDRDPAVAIVRFTLVQKPSGEYALLDDNKFKPSATLKIALAAPDGGTQYLFNGFITHIRPHFQRQVQVAAYCEVIAMDALSVLDVEERVAVYEDTTDSDAASKIFGRYGISVTTDPSDAKHEEKKQMLVQRSTDYAFLKRLAARNGFVCYVESDDESGTPSAFFGKPKIDKTPQDDLTVLRAGENLVWVDFQYKTTGAVKWTGSAFDPFEKTVVSTTATGGNLQPIGGGSDVGSDVESGIKKVGASDMVGVQKLLRDPLPFDQQVNAESKGRTDMVLFKIEAQGQLDPASYKGLIRAHTPVVIKGVGSIFGGVYYVKTVRSVHNPVSGDVTQMFTAERNATGADTAPYGKQESDEEGLD